MKSEDSEVIVQTPVGDLTSLPGGLFYKHVSRCGESPDSMLYSPIRMTLH